MYHSSYADLKTRLKILYKKKINAALTVAICHVLVSAGRLKIKEKLKWKYNINYLKKNLTTFKELPLQNPSYKKYFTFAPSRNKTHKTYKTFRVQGCLRNSNEKYRRVAFKYYSCTFTPLRITPYTIKCRRI